jgi:hypothetical protein
MSPDPSGRPTPKPPDRSTHPVTGRPQATNSHHLNTAAAPVLGTAGYRPNAPPLMRMTRPIPISRTGSRM